MSELFAMDPPGSELISARDAVRADLLRDILHGNVAPLPTEAHPLSENAVMERYGQQSRMPVRMALAVLSGEGLLRQRARHGFWLVRYDLEDVEQILRMRAGIEAMVAAALSDSGIGSAQSSSNELDSSRASFWETTLSCHRTMGELVDEADGQRVAPEIEAAFADADTQFHFSLARAAGYDVAARHIMEWRNEVRIFRLQREIGYSAEALRAINNEHSDIIGAIQAADGTLAAELARSHVERAFSRERVARVVEVILDEFGLKVDREPVGSARPAFVARADDGKLFVIEIKHGQPEPTLDAVAELQTLRKTVADEFDQDARGVLMVVGDVVGDLDELTAEAGEVNIELVQVESDPGSIRESLISSGIVGP
jgi:DNA-binding GntR family transcriptional regulator